MDPAPSVREYRLRLEVDFRGLTWDGSVDVDLGPHPKEVVLDAEGLSVRSVTVHGRPVPWKLDPVAHAIAVALVPSDSTQLRVDFSGRVVEGNLIGFYRTRHGPGYALVTQCEPIGARKVFPCIDRPDCKAPIRLTVVTDPGLEVVSNSSVLKTADLAGRKEWTFEPTPSMATYLFFLGIGEFDILEDRSARIALRVLTPPGRAASGRYALDTARRVLEAYEAYYGIPYPLPKLDLVAVAEHAFGAMENWGALSFRDMRLLVDETTSSRGKDEILDTISHEIAHQWFGNLVTMVSWSDIWLNESFASFLSSKIAERVDPAFDARSAAILNVTGAAAAFQGDSLRATHPVRAEVHRPEEISQIFDEISYGKGSALLAMFEAYLGPEKFRAGVTRYLDRFRGRNAKTSDLWGALAETTGEPVAEMLGPWVDRPGLPLVRATLEPGTLHLAQERFLLAGVGEPVPWPIPVTMEVNGRSSSVRFDGPEMRVPVPDGAVVHLNPGASGFYRVLYDAELLDRLYRVLPGRSAADRWIVLDDLSAFLPTGRVGWPSFERFARALSGAHERLVVEALVYSLGTGAICFPDHRPVLELARTFLARQFDRVGLHRHPSEPAQDAPVRESVTGARVRIDQGFARDLSETFVEWERLDAEVRGAAALARTRTEGASGYREVQRALKQAVSEIDTLRLERALAWSSDPTLVEETLGFTLNGTVNRGHAPLVIIQAATNPYGRDVTWNWLTRHLNRLDELFRGAGFLSQTLESVIPLVGLGRRAEVAQFFQGPTPSEGTRGVVKGLERLAILEMLGERLPTE
ncbi:MAG TPA: M1 family metallopeptidase [Thermoplasmata archaeon]|nr:M1 family metallopeptidase [Thermoplasmata archaeon]